MSLPAVASNSSGKQGATGGALLLFSTLTAASVCEGFTLSPSAGLTHSQWQEFSASGSRLVKETGVLELRQLDTEITCGKLEWHAHWLQSQGRRHYLGVTSQQQSATSTSEIRMQSLQIDTLVRLSDHWSGGLGMERQVIDRNILSTPQAAGYPERFSQWTVRSGLRYQHPLSQSTHFFISTWLGHAFPGHVWLDLPNAEPARLSLGSGRVFETTLTLANVRSIEPGWSWAAQVTWRASKTTAGKPQAVVNNGRLIGSAVQPITGTESLSLRASVKYVF